MTFDIFNRDMPLQFANDVSNNKNIVNKQLNQNSIKDIYLQKAKEESEKLIKEFTEQNISLDKALDFIKVKYPKFKEEYNKQISIYQDQNYNLLRNSYLKETQLENFYNESFIYINNSENVEKYITSFSSAYQKNRELVSKLKTLKISLITLAAAASAAVAAGFYAAIPWTFGATLPWAIGCTGVVTFSSTAIGFLSACLLGYDKEAGKWEKAGNAFTAAITAEQFLAKRSKEFFLAFNTSAASFSWAMSSLVAVLAVGLAIYAWINYNYR